VISIIGKVGLLGVLGKEVGLPVILEDVIAEEPPETG
jgi:hypothetical protein